MPKKGYYQTEEHKQKIRLHNGMKGKPTWIKGKHHTEETIQKIRLAKVGKHHTEETIQKIRLAKVGKHHTEETIQKMRLHNGMKGKHHTEEQKQKISKALKGHLAWNKGKHHTEETRQKIKLHNEMKGKHHTEETIQKIINTKIIKKCNLSDIINFFTENKHNIKSKSDIHKIIQHRDKSKVCGVRGIQIIAHTHNTTLDKIFEYANINFQSREGHAGIHETEFFNKYEQEMGVKLLERQKLVAGFFIDAYNPVTNTAIEYDEPHHYINGKLRVEDIIRENKIKEVLNCNFIRIKQTQVM